MKPNITNEEKKLKHRAVATYIPTSEINLYANPMASVLFSFRII